VRGSHEDPRWCVVELHGRRYTERVRAGNERNRSEVEGWWAEPKGPVTQSPPAACLSSVSLISSNSGLCRSARDRPRTLVVGRACSFERWASSAGFTGRGGCLASASTLAWLSAAGPSLVADSLA